MITLNHNMRAGVPLDQYVNSIPGGYKLHHWPDWISDSYRHLSVSRLRGDFKKVELDVIERNRRAAEYEYYMLRRERLKELKNSKYVTNTLNLTPAANNCRPREMAMIRCAGFVISLFKEIERKDLRAISAKPVGDEVSCFHCTWSNKVLAWGKYARVWSCSNVKCAGLGVTSMPAVTKAILEEFEEHRRLVGMPDW